MPYGKRATKKKRGIHSARQGRFFGLLAGRGVKWAKDKLRGTRNPGGRGRARRKR